MGAFGRAHGIRGEIALHWQGGDPPAAGVELYCGQSLDPVALQGLRSHNGRLLVTLKGLNDRSAVEGLTGKEVFVRRAGLPPLEEGEVYLADLVGAVIKLEDGTPVGVLDHIESAGGQEIWAIQSPAGREILFPARPEFIAAIDGQGNEVTVSPPPGLLEVYNA